MTDTTETQPVTWNRHKQLNSTIKGAAFAALLNRYPTDVKAAEALGVGKSLVTQCVKRGQASRNLAVIAQEVLGIPKESVRPDLTAEQWLTTCPGRKIDAQPDRDGYDQETLRQLAVHFGSVRKFTEAASITIARFHSWLSRCKIPAAKKPYLLAMGIPESIKARLSAVEDGKQ